MHDLSNGRHAPSLLLPAGIQLLPAAARFSLRGDSEAMASAGRAFGVSLSTEACRSARNGARAALWVGPDEQLLLAPATEGALIAGQMSEALGGLRASLVDISHRQIALQLSGPHARNWLNAGCPLDLDRGAFPVGMCTRTLLGKASVVLWRTELETFHVEIWRSFAGYVAQFLAEAGRELGC